MKLKRYTAPDIRQAMAKVRDELGSDAVILSNRKIEDGIEIIAAIDYDDAMLQTPLKTKQQQKIEQKTEQKIATKKNSRQVPAAEESLSKNKSLAQHLSKSIENGPNTAQWKKAFEGSYEAESLGRAMQNKPTAPKKIQNTSQVSSEWVDQFSSIVSDGHDPSIDNSNQDDTFSKMPNSKRSRDEIREVRDELSSLRSLLETQLSSLAWSDATKRSPTKAKVLRHLLELGLTPEVSYQLLSNLADNDNFESCWCNSLARFVKQIPVVKDDIIVNGGVFALIGPTGVGKTTTIAKMAARFALMHGTDSIALVTTDNYRIGAQEQLRTYGRILGTPVKVANDADELRKVLKSLYDKELILIDTAGMSQRDIKLTEQFSMLSEGSTLIKSYLVISASSQQQVLDETVEAYKKAYLDGCIMTKIDETLSLGGVLSTIAKHKLPITYISDGQRVPEDLHRASPVDLVKKSIAMMNHTKIQLDETIVELAYGSLVANDLS